MGCTKPKQCPVLHFLGRGDEEDRGEAILENAVRPRCRKSFAETVAVAAYNGLRFAPHCGPTGPRMGGYKTLQQWSELGTD